MVKCLFVCLTFMAIKTILFSQASAHPNGTDSSRIINGQATSIEEHPYQIGLWNRRSFICGGSLLGTKWVLTAAHCVDGVPAKLLLVRAGVSHLSDSDGLQIRKVARIHQHPQYDSRNYFNDIAILEMANPFDFNKAIKAVVLAKEGKEVAAGRKVLLTGWGSTTIGGPPTNTLLMAILNVVTTADCANIYAGYASISTGMVCAEFPPDGNRLGACKGDSGGPLVLFGPGGSRTQIGIVSWGYGCAREGAPGVYTKVSAYIPFIKYVIS